MSIPGLRIRMTEMVEPELPVQLSRMHQLVEARTKDDDWTGLKDRAERRKRQTRLNVRAHRKRKIQQQPERVFEPPLKTFKLQQLKTSTSPKPNAESSALPAPYSNLSQQFQIWYQTRSEPLFISSLPSSSFNPLSPNGSIILPLSRDHLIPLVQYNVFRAILTNRSILALPHGIPRKRNPSTCPQTGPLFPAPTEPPPSLAPTPLQLLTPHDVWIDTLPDGTLRDNAIRYMGTFDEEVLCRDLVGGFYEGQNDIELTGVLAWNDPWRASGWEVTEGFVKKWGFLIKGCWEIMTATNQWREMRGDEPLVFEL